MRVIICGSRDWEDDERIWQEVSKLPEGTTVVVGGACGPDLWAEVFARKIGFVVNVVRADWRTHGKRAGHIRNHEMAQAGADECIAFWDGRSKGTQGMIGEAIRAGIPVRIIPKRQVSERSV